MDGRGGGGEGAAERRGKALAVVHGSVWKQRPSGARRKLGDCWLRERNRRSERACIACTLTRLSMYVCTYSRV